MHQHSAYLIEVPARWNGELVLWAHGYRGQGTVLYPENGYELRQKGTAYGCRFSDPSAWAAGTGTRLLFPACP